MDSGARGGSARRSNRKAGLLALTEVNEAPRHCSNFNIELGFDEHLQHHQRTLCAISAFGTALDRTGEIPEYLPESDEILPVRDVLAIARCAIGSRCGDQSLPLHASVSTAKS